MKKKLEAELISIAHRILKLKNKSELIQLQREAQQLYEKLSVMLFVEENFADVKPTIGQHEAEDILATAFDEKDVPTTAIAEEILEETKPVAEETSGPEAEAEKVPGEDKTQTASSAAEALPGAAQTPEEKEADEVIAEVEDDISNEEETPIPAEENAEQPAEGKEDGFFKPTFEWAFDAKSDEAETPEAEIKQENKQVAFEDLLGAGYVDPVFVKPEGSGQEAEPSEAKSDVIPISRRDDKVPVFKMNSENAVSLNDRLSKGITVGLNDRIAFVKNLFNNSNEDYNRVLSQLITYDTFAEAQDFIDNMVKPDYNNWEGKDEYAQRFMEVVEKKFS